MSASGKAEVYEAVVVGGGPAGAAAAIMLARAGRRVLLLEAASATADKIGEALPPAARPLLQALGVWEHFVAAGKLPCSWNLSAWGTSHLQCPDFIFDPNGHGWHLHRPRFDALLRREAALAGAAACTATALRTKVQRLSDGQWYLTLLPDGEARHICCRWLIDATGRRCTIARWQGARRRSADTLIALAAVFSPAAEARQVDQDSRTLIEAAPDGWWYTALL